MNEHYTITGYRELLLISIKEFGNFGLPRESAIQVRVETLPILIFAIISLI